MSIKDLPKEFHVAGPTYLLPFSKYSKVLRGNGK